MTAPAIEIRQLRKKYRKVEALRGLDLEVPRGSICGFLGPNGAGKTTTLKILMGLIRSSGGWASVLGDDVRTHGLVARGQIGYLPQDPVFPASQTVRGVVSYVARLYPGHPHGRALRSRLMIFSIVSAWRTRPGGACAGSPVVSGSVSVSLRHLCRVRTS